MTALAHPTVSLRHRLLAAGIEILPAQVVQPGRVMWCRGRKTIGFCNLADLKGFVRFPSDADTACLSPIDYERISGE